MPSSVRENMDRLFAELPDPPPTVIAVSKYATVSQIEEAYAWGIRDFGENKIQDLQSKIPQLPADIRWHFLGHLQRNKINKTVELPLALIHTVDSAALAEALSVRYAQSSQRQPVLLQINWTENAAQSGFAVSTVRDVFSQLLTLPGLAISGLMGIAPHTTDTAAIHACFAGLHDLRDHLARETGHPLPTLSMGMSGDFHHALDCGATMLRIGNNIFRPSS